jgi:hypothetical protein
MVQIIVKSKKHGDRLIKIDEQMVNMLNGYTLSYNAKTKYVQCHSKNDPTSSTIPLQRLVKNPLKGEITDHVNGCQDDYTDANLENTTQDNNVHKQKKHKSYYGKPTSSPYKGVNWNKKLKKWYVSIHASYIHLNLGNYSDPRLAAVIYNIFARKLFGKYTTLNRVKITKNELAQVNLSKLCKRASQNLLKHDKYSYAEKLGIPA